MYKIIGADKAEYGPVSADQLRQWVREGRANGQTMVMPEGGTEWKPLSSYAEFADALNTPPTFATGPAAQPGAPTGLPVTPPTVPNYLTQAILCTLCCCLPFGIVAIIYSAQVNTKLAAGDYAGAQASSKNAKIWCWVSFGLGVVGTILYVGLSLLGAMASHQ